MICSHATKPATTTELTEEREAGGDRRRHRDHERVGTRACAGADSRATSDVMPREVASAKNPNSTIPISRDTA